MASWSSVRHGSSEGMCGPRTLLLVTQALLLAICVSTAHAQVDLSGSWAQKVHHDFLQNVGAGALIGDLTGLPINGAARLRAESWDEAAWNVPERQCESPAADSASQVPTSMHVLGEFDPETRQLVAWRMVYMYQDPHRVIWMDHRPHPSKYAAHSASGFSTGQWLGDTLIVKTTHLKEGWIRRNGVARSDLGVLTEYWMRHGNYLTVTSVVEDPVYLVAPYIHSSSWVLDPGYRIGPYSPCIARMETDLPRGFVAHHLPGTNKLFNEFPQRSGLPVEAAYGSEETIYPEYMEKLGKAEVPQSIEKYSAAWKRIDPRHDSGRQAARKRSKAGEEKEIAIEPLQVRINILLLASQNGNTTVQFGEDGPLIIDTQRVQHARGILREVSQRSQKPIRYIINTSAAAEKIGGNAVLSQAGRTLGPTDPIYFGPEKGPEVIGARIFAHENVLSALKKAGNGGVDKAASNWPTDIYFTSTSEIFFNGEAVDVIHVPRAHSDGDSIVYFRRSDVVSTGDVFSMSSYPVIDVDNGGTINGVIAALNRIIDITVPEKNGEGGTLVIPGRGRLCDEYDVVMYRDMITIIRDRIERMIKDGMSLDQIKSARPTADYDGRFGVDEGPEAIELFVEAAYRSLLSGEGA